MPAPRRGARLGRTAVALAVALVLVSAGTPAGTAGVGTTQPDTDSTVTRIAVYENGTAAWEVQVRTRLTSEADVEDYETFQASFRENTSQYLDSFRRSMRGVVADAANQTGREMRAQNFTASTSIQAAPRRWGIVSYRFRWTNFAVREGDAVVMGDVFGGEFLLTTNDTLAVVAPTDYRVAAVAPDPAQRTDRRVRWFGRRIFADGRPFVRFEPADGTETPDGDPGATPTDGLPAGNDGGSDGGGDGSDGGGGVPLFAVGVLALVVVALGVYRYVEHNGLPGDGRATTGGGADRDAGGTANASSTAGRGDATRTETAGAATEQSEGVDGESASEGAVGESASEGAAVDPQPVITDAERVEQLLEEHDGQLHQSDIVDALDWSKSKTSRVLSDMTDEGRVEKLRIGRQNVIRLDSADGTDEGE